MRVRPYQTSDLGAVAGLVADRQRRLAAGGGGSGFDARFTGRAAATTLVERVVAEGRAEAAVAEAGGSVVGFLAGVRQLFAPEDFASIYAEPRSISVPLHGHAVADGVPAEDVYTALYRGLSERWVARGFYAHTVGVAEADADARESWFRLGFGIKSTCAVRAVAAEGVAAPAPDGYRFERTGGADDAVADAAHRDLMTYQTGAPMFWPFNGEQDARVTEARRGLFDAGDACCFVARSGGDVAGSLVFTRPVFLSPLVAPDASTYLWEAFLQPRHRSSGVGARLLEFALAELATEGVRWCSLHYVAGNYLGGPFWRRAGFDAVERTLRRHVDERIAWATGVEDRGG